eukprot:TRINITY_DN12009_c0_g1_i1.p1 TRINITY_DN12009_c0_g1~~TRINITY_DN12009_c0_g1_i1.p1  ORF type:complete len:1615 (+),score=578.52 TRINITY_DN12009_c0_g1_i1:65-4909(+)
MEHDLSSMIRCVEVLASDGLDPPKQLVFKGCIEEPEGAIDVVVKVLGFNSDELDRMLEDIVPVESAVVVHKILPVQNGRWIVMDCCDCSVGDAIALVHTLTEDEIKAVAAGVLEGLSQWHVDQLGHGNVKPNNILISAGQVLLGDQGMADLSIEPHPARVCPEGDEGSDLPPADVWALGISLIEMVDKVPPYFALKEEEIADVLASEKPLPEITSRFKRSPEMDDFIARCLEKSPDQRETIETLRDHPWLEGVEEHYEESLDAVAEKVASVMREWQAVNGMFVPTVRIRKLFQDQLAESVRSMSSSVDINASLYEPVILPEVPPVGYTQLPDVLLPEKAPEPQVFQGKRGGEHWISKPDPTAAPQDHLVADVAEAKVYILGANLNVDAMNVTNAHLYIGPCRGRVRLQNLVDTHVSVAAKRVELHGCKGVTFEALYSEEPVIMSECMSDSFSLKPWHWQYPLQGAMMKLAGLDPYCNRWNELETADADDSCAGGLQLLADPNMLFASTPLGVPGLPGDGEQAVYLTKPLRAPIRPDDDTWVQVTDRKQVKVVKRPGEWTGGSVSLQRVDRSEFFFLDNLKAVELVNLKFCVVVLGPAESVVAQGLEGCVVIAACRDIKVVGCSESCLFLWTETPPVVAGCSELDVGEFNVSWPLLDQQVQKAGFTGKANRFQDVVDPNPSAASDFHLLEEVSVRAIEVFGADGALVGAIPPEPFGDMVCDEGEDVPDFPAIHPEPNLTALRPGSASLSTTHAAVQLPSLEPAAGGPAAAAPGAVLRKLSNTRVVKHDTPSGDVVVEGVGASEIFILSPARQGVVRGVSDSVIVLGPTTGRVIIENCERSTVVAAAGQVVVKGCVGCRLHLWCAHDFVLHSSSVTLLPWNVVYPKLKQHAVEAFGEALVGLPSRHGHVFNFSKDDVRFPEPQYTVYGCADVAVEVISVDGASGTPEEFPFTPVPSGAPAAAAPAPAAPVPEEASSARSATAAESVDSRAVPETPSDPVVKVTSPNEVSNMKDERIERELTSLKGGDFEGSNLEQCTVIVADTSDSATLTNCTDCQLIIGPSRGVVALKNLTRCKVWCVGQQVRLTGLTDCQLHVFTTTPVKATKTTGTTISPFNARLPNLSKLFMRARLHDETNVFAETRGIDDSCSITHPEYRGILSMQGFKLLCKLMDEPTAPDYIEDVFACEQEPEPVLEEKAPQAAPAASSLPLHKEAAAQALRSDPLSGPWDVPGTAMPTKKKWEKAEVTPTGVSFYRGKTVVIPESDAKKGQQVELMQLHDCRVVVLGSCNNYMVDDCTNCEFVLGPCSGSLFIRDCSDLCVTAVCQQLRLRDLKNVEFFIHTETDPCVESSSHIVLHPLNIRLPNLTASFEEAKLRADENRFRHAADFNRFVDAALDDGFSIPPYVGVLRMRTTDLEGHGALDAPDAVEAILNGTCEGGESLESATFTMGSQGVDMKAAAEEHARREAQKAEAEVVTGKEHLDPMGEVDSELTMSTDKTAAEAPPERAVSPPTDLPSAPPPAAPEAPADVTPPPAAPEAPADVTPPPAAAPKTTTDLLAKLSALPIPAPRGMSSATKQRFEAAMRSANAELTAIKTEWSEIERLEAKVDALLSKMGLQ